MKKIGIAAFVLTAMLVWSISISAQITNARAPYFVITYYEDPSPFDPWYETFISVANNSSMTMQNVRVTYFNFAGNLHPNATGTQEMGDLGPGQSTNVRASTMFPRPAKGAEPVYNGSLVITFDNNADFVGYVAPVNTQNGAGYLYKVR